MTLMTEILYMVVHSGDGCDVACRVTEMNLLRMNNHISQYQVRNLRCSSLLRTPGLQWGPQSNQFSSLCFREAGKEEAIHWSLYYGLVVIVGIVLGLGSRNQ